MYVSPAPATSAADPATTSPSRFQCSRRTYGRDSIWLHASGRLDLPGARRLEQDLDEAQTQALLVVLDLHDLTFMDLAGVHMIVEAARYARLAGHRLVILRGPQAPDVFDLTGATSEIDSRRLGTCV